MMRIPQKLEREPADETIPTKSDINRVIMDYLVSEGYPEAAKKFAQETNLSAPADLESIKCRVRIKNAIHAGFIDTAITLINDLDPEILDTNPYLHFQLLQLQLIEIIRKTLDKSASTNQPIVATDFLPAIEFATEQLSPRAPTNGAFQSALEHTMALMIFPPDKMTPQFKELLDLRLREKIASDVNATVLRASGSRAEAKIRELVRARAWAEAQAQEAKVYGLPAVLPLGLDAADEAAWSAEKMLQQESDAMIS